MAQRRRACWGIVTAILLVIPMTTTAAAEPVPAPSETDIGPRAPIAMTPPGPPDTPLPGAPSPLEETGDAPRLWESRLAPQEASWEFTERVALSRDGARAFLAGSSTGDGSSHDLLVSAYDADTGAEAWTVRVDLGGNTDTATDLVVSPDDSRVYVTGYGFRGGFAVLTLALDAATGTELWRAVHDPAVGEAGAYALAMSPDGDTLFATGTASLPETNRWTLLTVAYDAATGAEMWSSRLPLGDMTIGRAVGVSSDGGRVVVTGWARAGISNELFTLAHDPLSGAVLWTAQQLAPTGGVVEPHLRVAGQHAYVAGDVTGDAHTVAYDVSTGLEVWSATDARISTRDLAVSPDGARLFATGSTTADGGDFDYETVARDAATGAELWRTTYDAAGNFDAASAIAVAADGTAVVTGYSDAADGRDLDMATVAYTDEGNTRWVHRLDVSEASDLGRTIAVGAGRVVVAGEAWSGTSQYDHALATLNGDDGTELARAQRGGPGRFGYDAAYEATVDPDGDRLYVAGTSHHDGLRMRVVAHDGSTGAVDWQTVVPGPSTGGSTFLVGDFPTGLATDPAGDRVFVTGLSDTLTHRDGRRILAPDWLTAGIDATSGELLWTARFGGGLSGVPAGVVSSVDGETIYVAGRRWRTATRSDIVVISYDAATGAERWRVVFGADGNEAASAVALSPDGGALYTTGRAWDRDRGHHVLTVAFDTADGAVQWTARRGAGSGFFTSVADIGTSTDGALVFVASSPEPHDRFPDYETVAYHAATGTEFWTATFDQGDSYETAEALDVDGDTVYVTGRTIPSEATATGHIIAGNDIATVAYDVATGAERWRAIHDTGIADATEPSVSPFPEDLGFDVTVAGEEIVAVGTSWSRQTGWDVRVASYERRSGAERWADRVDLAGSEDIAFAATAAPDGRTAYVVGKTTNDATLADFHTIAYATGDR